MDNLDRTNVAQSAIAKWMLSRQLRDIGVFKEYESVDDHQDFMFHFRNSKQKSSGFDIFQVTVFLSVG